jgi:hypothetical protein
MVATQVFTNPRVPPRSAILLVCFNPFPCSVLGLQRELVVVSAHDAPDPISEHAVDPTPEAEAEAEGDIMEALRRRWQAEEEDKEREAAAIAARSKQREVSAAVIAEEEMQRREAILRSQREAAALKQLKRQQAQVDDPVSAVCGCCVSLCVDVRSVDCCVPPGATCGPESCPPANSNHSHVL